MSRTARMGVCLATACLLLGRAVGAAAQQPEILVSEDQVVTLNGSSASLRDVIQQLCVASGVELRQYDAQDRPFVGAYEGVPLSELLPRLLRSESYAAGLRSTAGKDNARIAWVRVMGRSDAKGEPFHPTALLPAPTAAPPPDAAAQGTEEKPMTEAELPPDQAATIIAAVLNPAFTTVDDENMRKQHIEKIGENFATNPASKTTLERADPVAVGQKLAQFPDARSVLAMIQSTIRDPEMQRRFNQIASSLNAAVSASVKPGARN